MEKRLNLSEGKGTKTPCLNMEAMRPLMKAGSHGFCLPVLMKAFL
jgi:hypothetical protein